jgi:hypothetical protein
MDITAGLMQVIADHDTRIVECIGHNKPAILAALKERGVVVQVEYSGSGDSGDEFGVLVSDEGREALKDVTVRMKQTDDQFDPVAHIWVKSIVDVEVSLLSAIERLAELLIERHHRGYEINEGGGGTLTFNGESDEIDYYQYDWVESRDERTVTV